MPNKRIIYVAIDEASADANGATFLGELKKEQKELIDKIDSYSLYKEGIDYKYPLESNWATISKNISACRADLSIFHFAGHSRGKFILLNNQSIDIEQGFKHFLTYDSAKNLKLIFLNGCSTYEHIEGILKINSKVAIIATTRDIPDKFAKDFAVKFYYNLIDQQNSLYAAFCQTLSQIAPNSDISQYTYRSLGPKPDFKDSIYWRFICEDEEIKNWKIVNSTGLAEKKEGQLIDPNYATDIDRTIYEEYFQEYISGENKERKFYHFFVLGKEEQAPISLARKLIFKKVTDIYKKESFFHSDRDWNNQTFRSKSDDSIINLVKTDNDITTVLYDRLTEKESENAKNLSDLIKIGQFSNKQKVFIYISISIKNWKFLKDDILKFINETIEFKDKQEKKFLFLWNVIQKKDTGMLAFLNNPPDDLSPTFKQISKIENTSKICFLNNFFDKSNITTKEEMDRAIEECSNLDVPKDEHFEEWVNHFKRITLEEISTDIIKILPLRKKELEFENWINNYNTKLMSNQTFE